MVHIIGESRTGGTGICYKPEAYCTGEVFGIDGERECNVKYTELGCEKWGPVWYPRCRAVFHDMPVSIDLTWQITPV